MKNGIVAAMTAVGLSASHSYADDRPSAWIAVDRDHGTVALQVFAALESGETGTYRLVSRKSGRSGSAVSQQAGRMGVGDGRARSYSRSQFSLNPGEALEAELTVTTSNGRTLVDKVTTVSE